MANFENIKLDKGLYRTRKGFLGELESVDPSENYKGTSLEGLDAFERQLKRFDIKINGKDSSPVEKFFQTTDSAVLFPEYVARTVRNSIVENNDVEKIIATKTNINSFDYRPVESIPSEDDLELKDVNEGAFIPETTIKTKENLVKLHKRGRTLVSSYEALRFQRLDIFNVALKQIGSYISSSLMKDAINVLLNGDGNNNPIEKLPFDNGSYFLATDILDLYINLLPYKMSHIIVSPDVYKDIYKSNNFNSANNMESFYKTGKVITPCGTELILVNTPNSVAIGLDKKYALEMVTAGDVLVDSDRLIDRQLEKTTITQIAGFAKIANDASKTFNFE